MRTPLSLSIYLSVCVCMCVFGFASSREGELKIVGASEAREAACSQLRELVTQQTMDTNARHSSELSVARQLSRDHMHDVMHVVALTRKHGRGEDTSRQMDVLRSFKPTPETTAAGTAVQSETARSVEQAQRSLFCGDCGENRSSASSKLFCIHCGGRF